MVTDEISLFIFGGMVTGIIICSIFLLFFPNYEYSEDLGNAICSEHSNNTMTFDKVVNEGKNGEKNIIVYCKEKENLESYDGIKISLGEK